MPTELEQSIQDKKTQEIREQKLDHLKRLTDSARKSLPTLKLTPFVELPFLCRRNLHKRKTIPQDSVIDVCVKCGAVWVGYYSGFGAFNMRLYYKHVGFIDPQKTLEAKETKGESQ